MGYTLKKDDRAASLVISTITIISIIAVLEAIIYVGALCIFGGSVAVPTGTIAIETSSGEDEITVSIDSLSTTTEFTDLEVVIYDGSGREMINGTEISITYNDNDDDGLASEGDSYTIARLNACFTEYGNYAVYLIYAPTGDEIDTASVTI
jgi:FlaG/FlaF family flagellin (archaellin)